MKAVTDAQGYHAALSMFDELERDNNVNISFDIVVYNTMISVSNEVKKWVETENIWRSL